MAKKLNIAFIWHFHQPVYQESFEKDFLMPWVRLHATKDYLDMLYRIDKFPRLRVNFNISPTLADSLLRYTNGSKDIHLRLLMSDISELNDEDKKFILNNFFDANYANMILTRKYYSYLYNKRFSEDEISTDHFSDQEYADIMTNHTLAWVDKIFFDEYPELKKLYDKEQGYTLKDRRRIAEITYDIVRKILQTYKEYYLRDKIEISTNPYYHSILPLLLDVNALPYAYNENLPSNPNVLAEDACLQTKKALDKFEELFGKRPKGLWLSEHCISKKTVNLLSELGIEWTIADEGILADTLDQKFPRDFEGNLEDPFYICKNYKLKGAENTNIVFADSFFANLVGFGYGNYEGATAANDLYERIKTIQNKLDNSPDDHILTIAMDGENCWESYANDGGEFLDTLYGLLENDESLETVLMSEYFKKAKNPIVLDNICAGSWINKNFDLWIGEPVKNLAWKYLENAREAYNERSLHIHSEDQKAKALEELHIAQGSDWLWWYGEPNESGQDHIFDHLFRTHLKNMYEILEVEHPRYLDIPLISIIGKPIRHPRRHIAPTINGTLSEEVDNWVDAGYIFLPDNPTSSVGKTVKGIYFGNDRENLYFKFEINKSYMKDEETFSNQLYIYVRTQNKKHLSPVRVISKTENMFPIVKNRFSHEIEISFKETELKAPRFSRATSGGLWVLDILKKVSLAYKDTLEVAISLKDLEVGHDEHIEFFIISGHHGVIDEVYPQDLLLTLTS